MAELKTRLEHLDEALTTGRLTLNAALSSDTVRVWETSDRRTMLTLHAVDAVGRIVARASTKYDGNIHQWLVFRHHEHEAITRVLESLGFVETPEDGQDGPSMAAAMDEIESIGEAPAGALTAEQLAEIREAARPGHAAVLAQLIKHGAHDLPEGKAIVHGVTVVPAADLKAAVRVVWDGALALLAEVEQLRAELEDLAAQNAKTESNFEEFAETIIPERDRYRLAYESARRGRRSARLLNRELIRSHGANMRAVAQRVSAVARSMHEPSFIHHGACRPNCPGCRVEVALHGVPR